MQILLASKRTALLHKQSSVGGDDPSVFW